VDSYPVFLGEFLGDSFNRLGVLFSLKGPFPCSFGGAQDQVHGVFCVQGTAVRAPLTRLKKFAPVGVRFVLKEASLPGGPFICANFVFPHDLGHCYVNEGMLARGNPSADYGKRSRSSPSIVDRECVSECARFPSSNGDSLEAVGIRQGAVI
jgi:hypothetical protein